MFTMFTLIALLRARYHEYINSDSRSPIRIFFKLLNEFAPWHPIRLMKNIILLCLSLLFAMVYVTCSLLAKGFVALVLAGISKILSKFSSNDSSENSDMIPALDSDEDYEDEYEDDADDEEEFDEDDFDENDDESKATTVTEIRSEDKQSLQAAANSDVIVSLNYEIEKLSPQRKHILEQIETIKSSTEYSDSESESKIQSEVDTLEVRAANIKTQIAKLNEQIVKRQTA